jgi:hypothetical protein
MVQMVDTTGKRVGITSSERLTLLPREAEVGDVVSIFQGVNVPFVLRKSGEHYRLVGSCYLHGMIDGQALEREEWQLHDIVIK